MHSDVFNQPDPDASKTRLVQIAEKYGVTEQDLGLYAKNDFVNNYAMKAYSLPVEYDENGSPTENAYNIMNEMFGDVQNSTSVEEAKQKYEKYAKKYPPMDYGNEDHHGEGEDHHSEDKGCYEKVCDTGYNFRFKNTFKVGSTMDGLHAIFLLKNLNQKLFKHLKVRDRLYQEELVLCVKLFTIGCLK